MPDLTIHYDRGGVHLPKLGLWLDPHRAREGRVFVSHAHSDHLARHRDVILSEPTARLMRHRLPGKRNETILSSGQPESFQHGGRDFRLTLLPAGHILGSMMAHVETADATLLYTGDFKLRRGLAAEPCEPRRADILIMETTFGRPKYQLPHAEKVFDDIRGFCRETLARGETPVLFAYSLGKSQELLAGLAEADLPVMLHPETFKITQLYSACGWALPACEKFDASTARGKVLIVPPQSDRENLAREIGPMRTAVVSGWAMDSSCRYRWRTDAAFPLSDHADFPDLLELVRLVQPKQVFTLHGFAADFAATLRDLGYDARALSEDDQLTLPFRDLSPPVPAAV